MSMAGFRMGNVTALDGGYGVGRDLPRKSRVSGNGKIQSYRQGKFEKCAALGKAMVPCGTLPLRRTPAHTFE